MAAGCVLLSPVVASAAETPTGNPTSMKVTVSGSTVTIAGTCVTSGAKAEAGYGVHRGHEPIDTGLMKANGKKQSITFTGVRPGNYEAAMYCHEGGPGSAGVVRNFTVGKPGKPKPAPQVAVKPQGAPQTGGGPADEESAAPALLAGGAIALVGAGGAVALRRRAAARR
ncbi:hypothetical protein DV20_27810 [Amycolatopsis rifamycinica]|uniref:Gram-positive cocci surface proteins LPxTG domain-containing protein n=1 Tax=Amycolatopsis rifamycinica TaxID=287986 RepID=A0A066TZH8_9PSEU|nr:hypothetical protein DV20_27810 [Amycolatopsis rifamycinica]